MRPFAGLGGYWIMDRRRFLQSLGYGASALAASPLLGACGGAAAPARPAAPPQSAAPAATSAPNAAVGSPVPAAAAAAAAAAAPAAPVAPAASGLLPVSSDKTPNPNLTGTLIRWQSTYDDPELPEAKYHDQY